MIIHRDGSPYARNCTKCYGWKLVSDFGWEKVRERAGSHCHDCTRLGQKEYRIRKKFGILKYKGRHSRFSAIEADVMKMIRADKTVHQILKRFPEFYTTESVRHFALRRGHYLRPNRSDSQRRVSPELLAKLKARLEAGMTSEEAGKPLGLNRNMVIGYNHRHNLVPLKFRKRYRRFHEAPLQRAVTLAQVR